MPIFDKHRGAGGKQGFGKTVLFRTVSGQAIASKWPKKQTRKARTKNAPRVDFFTKVQGMFPYLPWWEHETWMRQSNQGPFLPRDIYTMNAYGRLFAIEEPDGHKMYPERSLYDVSQVLDVVAQKKGQIIVRGNKYYEPIEPGDAGTYLRSNGPGELPTYEPAGGGGGGAWEPPALADFAPFITATGAQVVEAANGGIAMGLAKADPEEVHAIGKPFPSGLVKVTAGMRRASRSNSAGRFGLVMTSGTNNRSLTFGFDNYNNYDPGEWSSNVWNDLATLDSFYSPGYDFMNSAGIVWFAFSFDGDTITAEIGPDPNLTQPVFTQSLASTLGSIDQIGLFISTEYTTDRLNAGSCVDWREVIV